MRGVLLLGDKKVEVRKFPDPMPGFGEVVVEMKASGLCGSDLRGQYRVPAEQRGTADTLKIAGHEPCGVVAEVGEGVTNVRVGDRVMVHHYRGCRFCKYCRIGYSQLCVHGHEVYGSNLHGGDADLMLVDASTCIPLPEGMTFEEGASCACGTGTAYQALKRIDISGRDTLAIFGQGPVGLSATLLGSIMGARIIAVDIIPERLELARRLGAAEVIDARSSDPVEAIKELTGGEGAEATMDCTGIAEARVNAVDSAKLFGRVCFVGEGGTVTLNVSPQVIHRHLTIYGSWTFSTVGLEETANYIVDRKVPLKDLITHRYSIDQAEEAFQVFDEGRTGKPVFVWE